MQIPGGCTSAHLWNPLSSCSHNDWLPCTKFNPEYSLEGLMLKLKLQYFGHLMQRADSLEKTPMLGKTEGKRRGQQRMRWLHSISDSMDTNLSKFRETLEDREAWRAAVHGIARSRTQPSDWTTATAQSSDLFREVSSPSPPLSPREKRPLPLSHTDYSSLLMCCIRLASSPTFFSSWYTQWVLSVEPTGTYR